MRFIAGNDDSARIHAPVNHKHILIENALIIDSCVMRWKEWGGLRERGNWTFHRCGIWALATSKNNSKSMTKLRLCKNVMNFPWGHFVGRDELNEWFWRISLQIIDNSLIEPIVSWYRIFGTNFTQWSDFSVSYYVFCVSWKLAFLECIFIFYFLPTNEGNFQFIWHKDHSTKGSSFVFEFLQSWK